VDEGAAPQAAAPSRAPWTGRKRRNEGPQWQVTVVPPRPAQDEPVERLLVRAMLHDRSVAEWVAERHPPRAFRHAGYAALFESLLAAPPGDIDGFIHRAGRTGRVAHRAHGRVDLLAALRGARARRGGRRELDAGERLDASLICKATGEKYAESTGSRLVLMN
jgi:hypothetical protein